MSGTLDSSATAPAALVQKRAPEALSYNALVQSWPEISRLASEGIEPRPEQTGLFGGGDR